MGGLTKVQLEKRRKTARDWYVRNRKKRLKQNKCWRDTHKAQISNRRKASYNPKKQRARFKKWYASNAYRVVDASAQWRKNNPEAFKKSDRKHRLKKRYGITPDDYDAMFKRQRGRCAICKQKSPKRLHVDHCHKTGRLRELLCNRCNLGIGYFDDEPRVMKNAAAYLTRHHNG